MSRICDFFTQNFITQIHVFDPLFFNSIVPYRDCDSVKNLKDPAGAFLKTICVIQLFKSYLNAEAICVKDKMKLAVIDSTVLETSVLDFTNKKFAWRSGAAFIEGNFGTTCKSVSNASRKPNDYKVTNTTCSSLQYTYCEYKKT